MKKIIILFLIIFLSNCSLWKSKPENTVKPIEIQKRVKPVEILHPPLPQSAKWEHFKWVVLTPEIIRKMLKEYDSGKLSEDNLVFFAVTPNGYEHLSVNTAEMLRYIEDQKGVIMYYRDTIPKKIFLPDESSN